MKLIYVNGYREDYKLSSTYLKLKEAGVDIEPCQWKYGDDVKTKIDNCVKEIKPKIIIASSTAGLFVTDYDIPVILINPVVDRKDLENLLPDKDFSNYPLKPSKKSPLIKVILGCNDEVLDHTKASKFFETNICLISNEGHSLKNITPILEKIESIKLFYYKGYKNYTFDKLITDAFSKEELEIIIEYATAISSQVIVGFYGEDWFFEICCDLKDKNGKNKLEITTTDEKEYVSPKKLIEKLKENITIFY